MPALKFTPHERITQLGAFVAAHGRLPSQSYPGEASLAHWVNHARRGDVEAPDDVLAQLRKIIRETPTAVLARAAQAERRRIEALVTFVTTWHRMPSVLGGPEERRLYDFMRRVRTGELSAAEGTRQRVAELVAEYGGTVDSHMRELVSFLREHRRLPRAATERHLYSRLRRLLADEVKTVDRAVRDTVEQLVREIS